MASTGWQPIGTAPKGVEGILYYPALRFEITEWLIVGYVGRGTPGATHWRPLPAPPKEAAHVTT